MSIHRILVIDDTPVIRDFLFEFLTDEGFEVDIAENGVIGLEMARKNDYFMIFCDVHMPVMNGLQTVKNIKDIRPDVPVVMTDSFPGKLAEEAALYGAAKCMAKPFSLDELRETIQDIKKSREVSVK